jgi:hypothetical protein
LGSFKLAVSVLEYSRAAIPVEAGIFSPQTDLTASRHPPGWHLVVFFHIAAFITFAS